MRNRIVLIALACVLVGCGSGELTDPLEAGNCPELAAIYVEHLDHYLRTVSGIDPEGTDTGVFAQVWAAAEDQTSSQTGAPVPSQRLPDRSARTRESRRTPDRESETQAGRARAKPRESG